MSQPDQRAHGASANEGFPRSELTKKVPKPWGEEIWWADQPEYAGKILKILKGKRLSLQYHRQKKESQYVLTGKIKLTVGASKDTLEEIILSPGQTCDIFPGTIHRLEALEDSEVLEVSTSHLGDVVRLEDDYQRPPEGNHPELDKELSQQSQLSQQNTP